jgi:hypothetical protein
MLENLKTKTTVVATALVDSIEVTRSIGVRLGNGNVEARAVKIKGCLARFVEERLVEGKVRYFESLHRLDPNNPGYGVPHETSNSRLPPTPETDEAVYCKSNASIANPRIDRKKIAGTPG